MDNKDLIARLTKAAKSYENQPESLAPIKKQMEQLKPAGPADHLNPNSAIYKKNLFLNDLNSHDGDHDGIDDRIEDRNNNGLDDVIDARLEASLNAMDSPHPQPKHEHEDRLQANNDDWMDEEPDIAFIGENPEGDKPDQQEKPMAEHEAQHKPEHNSPFKLPSARDKPRPD